MLRKHRVWGCRASFLRQKLLSSLHTIYRRCWKLARWRQLGSQSSALRRQRGFTRWSLSLQLRLSGTSSIATVRWEFWAASLLFPCYQFLSAVCCAALYQLNLIADHQCIRERWGEVKALCSACCVAATLLCSRLMMISMCRKSWFPGQDLSERESWLMRKYHFQMHKIHDLQIQLIVKNVLTCSFQWHECQQHDEAHSFVHDLQTQFTRRKCASDRICPHVRQPFLVKVAHRLSCCRPMARGMLTGKLDLKNLPDNDFRKGGHNPQFNEDNVDGVSTKLHLLLPSANESTVLESLRSSSCATIAAIANLCCWYTLCSPHVPLLWHFL